VILNVKRSDVIMGERLTWDEIKNKYPDQWVGMTDVEYKPDNSVSIKSAIVTYTGLSKAELTRMMLEGKCVSRYTTPDNKFQMGMIGVL
jgi:hypothetical protein